MKNFFESFTTIVILAGIIFGCVSLMVAQAQMVAAREVHSAILRTVEDSDESAFDDVNAFRVQLDNSVRAVHNSWYVELEKLESSNSRDYYLVTLNYNINVPIFGNVVKGKIEGYAR